MKDPLVFYLSFPLVGNPSEKQGKDSGQAGMTDKRHVENAGNFLPHLGKEIFCL
jgi:hypothetical protein